MARLLIAHGADVNAKDSAGRTPLHYAADSPANPVEAIEQLLAAGAAVDVVDKHGKTPINLATDPRIIELLKQHASKK